MGHSAERLGRALQPNSRVPRTRVQPPWDGSDVWHDRSIPSLVQNLNTARFDSCNILQWHLAMALFVSQDADR